MSNTKYPRVLLVVLLVGLLAFGTGMTAAAQCNGTGDQGQFKTETAFGGDSKGDVGPPGKGAWWYYFDRSNYDGAVIQTQTIWAGKHYNAGSVTVSPISATQASILIAFALDWSLQPGDESVKIQGYNEGELPARRPAAGRFTTYKGNALEVVVGLYDYYVIHLDLQYCGPAISERDDKDEDDKEEIRQKRQRPELTSPPGLKIRMRGRPFQTDLPPVIRSGRVLIPLRAVANGMKADVQWDSTTNIVTIRRGDVTIRFDANSQTFFVNGVQHEFDVKPHKSNNRTFVPLRFIAEALGEKVKFNAASRQIDID